MGADTKAGLPDKIVGTWSGTRSDGNILSLPFNTGVMMKYKEVVPEGGTALVLAVKIDLDMANDDLQAYEGTLYKENGEKWQRFTLMFTMDTLQVKFDEEEESTDLQKVGK